MWKDALRKDSSTTNKNENRQMESHHIKKLLYGKGNDEQDEEATHM